MDLISRQAAIDAVESMLRRKFGIGGDLAEITLAELPSAQPERKTGRWIDAVLPNDNGGLPVQVCDQCNTFFPLAYTGGGHRFCPNCGAKMEGGADGI